MKILHHFGGVVPVASTSLTLLGLNRISYELVLSETIALILGQLRGCVFIWIVGVKVIC